jgi:outer membrane lipoprotein-sorting protein
MQFRSIFVLFLTVGIAAGQAAASEAAEALRLVDRLQERLAQCRDYQCLITSYERKGGKEEERTYRLYVKDSRLVRVRILAGRDKNSEAALDASGRIRARKTGVLKAFPKTMNADDDRLRSLRGTPFWEAACHNFLKDLRLRMTKPGTRYAVEPDGEQSDLLLLTIDPPGLAQEKVWVDPELMHVVRGERYEGGMLVNRFTVREVKENVGLNDGFFSF